MKVEIGNEMVPVELVDACSESLRDVIVRHVLANNSSVLCLHKSIVIGVIGSTLCLLCLPSFEELLNNIVDVLTSVVTVKVLDDEWEERKCLIKSRLHTDLLQSLHGNRYIPLRYFIHVVDVVDALFAIAIALMHRIRSKESWYAIGFRLPAFSNRCLYGFRLLVCCGM